MPHGGGGHHHSGGGGVHHHHHGGFRHHHHHHRHRNGFNYYYGTPYGYGYRRRSFFWLIFSIVFTIVIILSTTFTVRYTASGDDDDSGLHYGPTDTRIISVSSVLCQAVTLVGGVSSDSGYEVYLYLLSSPPKLTGQESFSVNDQPSFYSQYQQYSYFMPSGSNFSMSACLMNNNQPWITFYMVKGRKNFEYWKDDMSHSEYHLEIVANCETSNDTYSYSVTADDFYYLVFYAGFTTSYDDVNITMNFDRTRYELGGNDTVIDSCFFDPMIYENGCSLGIPLSGGTTLLEVSPSDDTDMNWSDKVMVDSVCSARIWMYALFSIAALIGIVGFLVLCTVFMCCCMRKKNKRENVTSASARTDQTVNAPLLYDASPLPGPMAPYQQSPSTSYGSTVPFVAPPVYKE